jgi:hypothetical protein
VSRKVIVHIGASADRHAPLELRSSERFADGVVQNRYRVRT